MRAARLANEGIPAFYRRHAGAKHGLFVARRAVVTSRGMDAGAPRPHADRIGRGFAGNRL